ncbi:MAG: LssY C-terminal domain-containing protein [Nocardioidaceae bacterium]
MAHPTARRITNRSSATLLWLLKRLLFVGGTLISGWAVYEFLIVPIIDDDDRIGAFLVLWIVIAYVVLPRVQRVMAKIYVPDYFVGRARTGEGLLGDPVNLAVLGSQAALVQAMSDAGWTRADELTLRSSLRLVRATILQRPYAGAPVSSLFLFTRKQDFAFEQEIPGKPSRRHHVRFWKCPDGWYLPGGLLVDWVGAGTYDRSVGFSLYTLQITHKIGENTDDERDHVLHTMQQAGAVESVHWVENYFSGYHSHNGGGDAISTDGDLPVVRLKQPATLDDSAFRGAPG